MKIYCPKCGLPMRLTATTREERTWKTIEIYVCPDMSCRTTERIVVG